MSAHRPPRDCPVCSTPLETTRLGCPDCGTGLVGHFRSCDFCGLDDADLTMLEVFLTSRGNMRDLERHLDVSYPTARARFDDLLRRLGLTTPPEGAQPADRPGAPRPADRPGAPRPVDLTTPGERLATLKALADGDLDVATARSRLATD